MIIQKNPRPLAELSQVSSYAYSSIPKRKVQNGCGIVLYPQIRQVETTGGGFPLLCAEKETFGVVDGVGGWAKKGVDAGKHARALMFNSELAVQHQPVGWVDPRKVLDEAFSKTEARGSSTACILTLTGHILRAVNIGDSGFVVIRNGKFDYKSRVQQHRFNCPFQLGNCNDNPSLAQGSRVFVEPETLS
ncbi:hypothetical protein RHMOL_Rhmol03G0030800 [Rhododendron molle]|uniref:Uncharacterized protein n=1 Tax=Rhododendron molle TaxID=49168 RepID=A0ACC0PB24_RHOML|nr:hypothetical protein RHMOL_Rhmol03G0030800 [Rhododendron molle]